MKISERSSLMVFANPSGLHYHNLSDEVLKERQHSQDQSTHSYGNIEKYRRITEQLASNLARIVKAGGHAMLVETIPQHFKTIDGSGDWDHLRLQPNGLRQLGCEPIKRQYSNSSWRNRIEQIYAAKYNIPIVSTFGPYHSRWDAHRNEKDCTHWCSRGGLIDLFLLSLLREVKQIFPRTLPTTQTPTSTTTTIPMSDQLHK